MSSVSSIVSRTSSYENFVQQLVQIESQKKLKLQVKQEEFRDSKTDLGQVSSAISKFESKLKELENPANRAFQPFKSSTSDGNAVKVNSSLGISSPSSFDITIHRLASRDIGLSQIMQKDGNTLAAEGDGSVTLTIGDKTATISVSTTKDDDEGGTINKTNEEILQSLADAISNEFGEEARANIFSVDDENVQFSVQSLQTGFNNRIQFSDATGVLSTITGGMEHLTPESNLNASFTIDGVTFSRSQNEISDAIEGLSFTLIGATDKKEQMVIERDLDKATKNIEDFVAAFNDLNTTIRNKTFINGETGERGSLQGQRSIRNLTFSLRQTALLGFNSGNEISRLSDLGITFEKNGNMTISDRSKLSEALSDNPDAVNEMFTHEESPIASMKNQVAGFMNTGGILSTIESGLDHNLDTLSRRIDKESKYLIEYEEKQRAIFNQLDLIMEAGQAQFDSVMNLFNVY